MTKLNTSFMSFLEQRVKNFCECHKKAADFIASFYLLELLMKTAIIFFIVFPNVKEDLQSVHFIITIIIALPVMIIASMIGDMLVYHTDKSSMVKSYQDKLITFLVRKYIKTPRVLSQLRWCLRNIDGCLYVMFLLSFYLIGKWSLLLIPVYSMWLVLCNITCEVLKDTE